MDASRSQWQCPETGRGLQWAFSIMALGVRLGHTQALKEFLCPYAGAQSMGKL